MSLQPYAIPEDGFAGTGGPNNFKTTTSVNGFNSSTAAFPVGTKVRYNNDTLGGYGTCIYLKYSDGAGTVTIVAGDSVRSTTTFGTVSADVTDQVVVGATAIAVGTVDDGNYGWFWCGGVCPDLNTAASTKLSATNATTDGTVTAAADFIQSGTDKTIKIAIATGLESSMGYSIAADTSNDLALSNIVLYDHFG